MCVSSGMHKHKFNVASLQAQRFVDKSLVGCAMKHRERKWAKQWSRIQNAANLTFFTRNAMVQQKQLKHNDANGPISKSVVTVE